MDRINIDPSNLRNAFILKISSKKPRMKNKLTKIVNLI